MQRNQPLNDGQPQPVPTDSGFAGIGSAEKALGEVGQIFLGNTRPGILNQDAYLAFLGSRLYSDRTLRGIFQGIVHQVLELYLQPLLVAPDAQARFELIHQAIRGFVVQHPDPRNETFHRHRLEGRHIHRVFQPGQHGERTHHDRHVTDLTPHDREGLAITVLIPLLAERNIHVSFEHRERCLQLMGRAGCEPAHITERGIKSIFSTTCLTCHNQTTWSDASFDHSSVSDGFALVGAHEIAVCASCHVEPGYDLLFSPAPSGNEDCLTCHQSDYDTEHGGGFPTTCLTCHNQTTWSGATFNHTDLSDGFQLIGSHEVAACESCHSVPGYELIFSPAPAGNEDCLTCHQSDYDNQHGGSSFPTTCLTCHNQVTWEGATFSHPDVSNGFELIGAHEIAACESCHTVPGYDLIFSPPPAGNEDCIACHQADYNSEHGSSGFPTTCLTCHNQTTWEGATFDHDALYFPIYSGTHRNEWNQCADCHRSAPITYATFSCIDCHEHRQSEMDDEHRGVSGYVWDSLACLSCHPDGRE